MKKVLSILLVLSMLLTILPAPVMAEGEIEGPGYSYSSVTKTLTIRSNEEASKDANWRKFENGYIIENVEIVLIEDNVTSIREYAFKDCTNLISIHIGSGVNTIAESAFISNHNWSTISINEYNATYKVVDGVLFTADGKTLIRYPQGKTGENYTVPSGVEELYISAFAECQNLTTVNLEEGLEII
jgi:hypothetical protein